MRTVDLAAVGQSGKKRDAYRFKTHPHWTVEGNIKKAISKQDWENYVLPAKKKVSTISKDMGTNAFKNRTPQSVLWANGKLPVIHFEKPGENFIPKIVYEIMFQYINPEVSLAYVQPMFLSDVPIGRKYFITSELAQHEVDKINSNDHPLCQ